MNSEANTSSNVSLMEQLIKADAGAIAFVKEGDLVPARFLNRSASVVFFDLGKYGTGIVYGRELMNAREIVRNLQPGDEVNVEVVNLESENGCLELSLVNVQEQRSWEVVKEMKESDKVMSVKIKGANSGGLTTDVEGLKAFLPASQLSSEHYPSVGKEDPKRILTELKKLVGEELSVKIIDVNPRAEKLIISEKEAVGENIKALLAAYKAGDEVEGIISGVVDFGVFVKFVNTPAIEGLIHISELDWRLIDNPKEIFKMDEVVKAKIIEIKNDKVFLSLKALKPNPWEAAGGKFAEGQKVSGRVYKFSPFGAYVDLGSDLFGSVHVSEFGSVEEMKKHLELGKDYEFTISVFKPSDKRISLKAAGTNNES